MFFLGISAHLFIYLLVPAFLVVCFYFNGIPGNSEVITLLPKVIIYESPIHKQSPLNTYVFNRIEQNSVIQKESDPLPEFSLLSMIVISFPVFYTSPFLVNKALRAPPVY